MAPDAGEKRPRRSEEASSGSGAAKASAGSAAGRRDARRRDESSRSRSRPALRGRSPLASLGRLRAGEAIYLAAAILLFILMFFDWYGMKATTSGSEPLGGVVSGAGGGSAWQTLEVIPLFLMLAIVVAVGAALLRLGKSTWKPAIPPGATVCLLGLLASLLILIRIVSPPGPDGALSELAFESTLRLPIFLALAAALGIAYGGWRAMGEEGTSFGGIAQRLESPGRPRRTKPGPNPAGRSKPGGRSES